VNFQRKYLALGAAAALAGAVAAPMPAMAFSVDAANGGLVTDDRGDALIFPIYTTSGELDPELGLTTARSSFSVTNTSPTQSLAVKIRFREQVTSQEVFDFIVFMSPEDKFDFRVKQEHDAAGNPTEYPRIIFDRQRDGDGNLIPAGSETSCIAPLSLYNYDTSSNPDANLFRYPLPPFDIPGVETQQDKYRALAVGHVEVIAMADITNASIPVPGTNGFIPLGAAVTHGINGGPPANCAAAIAAFTDAPTLEAVLANTAFPLQDAPDSLIGRMLVTIPEAGVEAGTNAITIKGLFDVPVASAQGPDQTCEEYPNQCTSWYAWDDFTQNHPHFGDSPQFANVEAALTADALANDWSRAEATNVWVDWIISFPTKYVYTDFVNCKDGDNRDREWCFVSRPNSPAKPITRGVWSELAPWPYDCQRTTLAVWDWDEFQNSAVSPSGTPPICNEVNVINIRENTTSSPTSLIQFDAWRPEFVFENVDDRERGWAELTFLWGTTPTERQGVVNSFGSDKYTMAPAVAGLAFTNRATGDPNVNNGSLTDLSRILDMPMEVPTTGQ
jgi:hypothetical protein